MKVIKKYKREAYYVCPACKTEFSNSYYSEGDAKYFAEKCLKDCTNLKIGDLPKYVKLGQVYMKLRKKVPNFNNDLKQSYLQYWVAYGGWGVAIKKKNNKLYSVHKGQKHLDNRVLTPVSERTYKRHTEQR